MKLITTSTSLCLLICLFCQCINPKKMSVTYTDGNNNSYRILNKQLKYTPMTMEHSSSGTYSGGKAQTVELTNPQIQEIKVLLDAAFDNTNIHTDKRRMGTAAISRKINDQFERIMIRAFCKEQKAIDQYLKALLKN